ncbi:Alpha/Beta hydrolase protein [Mycena galericulata]|nr:Alpha/Beta hydrolase protein [Mycena galericulata]
MHRHFQIYAAVDGRNSNNLLQGPDAPFPPSYFAQYISLPAVTKAIGATSTYSESPEAPGDFFDTKGDNAHMFLPQLTDPVESGMRVLMWYGDQDNICNWIYAAALAMQWYGAAELAATPLANITLDGMTVAAVAKVKNFTFALVYNSGQRDRECRFQPYQPAASLAFFEQVIPGEPLHSV